MRIGQVNRAEREFKRRRGGRERAGKSDRDRKRERESERVSERESERERERGRESEQK